MNTLEAYSKGNTSALFQRASYYLGFPGQAANREQTALLVENAPYVNVAMERIPLSLDTVKLYPEIRSAIADYKDRPEELEFFICDIIEKFSGISSYIYPHVTHKSWDEQIRAFTILATTDHYDPADSVKNEWRKYEKYRNPKLTESQLDDAVDYRLELFHNYFKTDVHGPVHSIISYMKAVAGLIDAALLENECKEDFFYYQKKSGSILTYSLDYYDLYSNAGINERRVREKLFDRSYYDEVAPSGLLLPELKDQISDYLNTGTWNMTKPSYIKVIAAPEDIRRSNLCDYLSAFQRYVHVYDENRILREMLAVFYDLWDLWESVEDWSKTATSFAYPCPDMIELFREQTVHHIAVAYFIYMINPKSCRFDIYTLYPGITREEVKDFICNQYHFLSEKDFDLHEREIEAIPVLYEPFSGYYSSSEKKALTAAPVEASTPPTPSVPAPAPAPDDAETPASEEDVEDIPAEGKNPETEKYRNAHHLYGRLCSIKLLKSRGDNTYNWIWKGKSEKQARVCYAYLCFLFWKYILREQGQLDRAVFCSMVHSHFVADTIGTYALNFKKQHENDKSGIQTDSKKRKVVPPGIKEKIDGIFNSLEKERYFDKPY